MGYKPRKLRKKKYRKSEDGMRLQKNDVKKGDYFSEQELIRQAQRDSAAWDGAFSQNAQRYRDDRYFLYENQWDYHDLAVRTSNGKPSMQFNFLISIVNQLISESRMIEPSIAVRATSPSIDQKIVDIKAGLIRQIMYENKFSIISERVFESMLTGGFGVFRLYRDYEDTYSFQQKIFIEYVDDPTSTFFDPQAKNVDKSDGRYCGYTYILDKEEFKKEYPEIDDYQSFSVSNYDEDSLDYETSYSEMIRICHYYVKEPRTVRVVKLSNGQVMEKKKALELIEMQNQMLNPNVVQMFGSMMPMLEIVEERKDVEYRIVEYKLLGNKVLESSDWPIDSFPLIFVPNDMKRIQGKDYTYSFIRPAIDSQRYLNYVMSESAVAVLNSRKEQFIGTPENFSGYEDMWKNPQRVQGALVANPDPRTGALPQRTPPMEIPQSLMAQSQQTIGTIQQILNRTEAALGQQSNELSGIAITNRAKRGDLGTYLYFDNLGRGIESVARVILKLIPHIYDTEQQLTIRNKNNEEQQVPVNISTPNGYMNDMTTKGFEVTVESSAGLSIQKQEALQQLMQLVGINPQVAPLVMDLIAANLDVENMPQVVERLKNLVPPEILAKEEGKPPPPPPQQQPDPMMLDMMLKQQKLKHEIEQDNIDNKLQQQKMMLEEEKMRNSAQIQREKMLTELKRAQIDKQQSMMKHLYG